MNTKEAIDEKINLLLNLEALYKHSGDPNYARIINDCIIAIKRGKKYEQMWEELLSNTYYFPTRMVMANIKQKYFPKEES